MTTEYGIKTDTVPNLYTILGLTIDICKDPNCNEIIHKAYMKKARVCHPDKHPGRNDVIEVFELLTGAYEILKDDKQRNDYNHRLSITKESSGDFSKLKKKTEEYMDSLGEYKPATDEQKLNFKSQMRLQDDKHGYDSSLETPLSKQDAKKKLEELTRYRSTQDVELKQERLFEDGRFDPAKFNKAFDLVHKREDDTIVAHGGIPSAWNSLGAVANFGAFDDFDNLYVDDGSRVDTERQKFSGMNFGSMPQTKLKIDDVQNLDGADYFSGHNELGDYYYSEMKARLRDRESNNSTFDSMKFNDFKRDETAGYGIFDQLGLKYEDRLCLDDDTEDDISKRFEKLMTERQREGMTTQSARQEKPVSVKKWR